MPTPRHQRDGQTKPRPEGGLSDVVSHRRENVAVCAKKALEIKKRMEQGMSGYADV